MSQIQRLTVANLKQVDEERDDGDSVEHKVDDSDDDCDSSSCSTVNSTSTYAHGHEPYETFQIKALALAQSISKSSHVELQRARGGTFNRVVIAHFHTEFKTASGIFRIPRDGPTANSEFKDRQRAQQALLNQVAVYEFIEQHRIPVPKLLAYDATVKNEIGTPFVMLELATGVSLATIYDEMSLPERLSVVDIVVNFLIKCETITNDKIGMLSAQTNEQTSLTWSSFTDEAVLASAVDITGLPLEDLLPTSPVPSERTLPKLLDAQFHAWQAIELGEGHIIHAEKWDYLLEIVQDMEAGGYFNSHYTEEVPNVLWHWDFALQNILVKQDPALRADDALPSWIIDTVLDWDDVLSVPAILTRKPPVWLWDKQGEDFDANAGSRYYAVTADDEPPSFYLTGLGYERMNNEDREVKQYFETTFVAKMKGLYPQYNSTIYQDEAYGSGAWVRRLARFAMGGMRSGYEVQRCNRLYAEWAKKTQVEKMETEKTQAETTAVEQQAANGTWRCCVCSFLRAACGKLSTIWNRLLRLLRPLL